MNGFYPEGNPMNLLNKKIFATLFFSIFAAVTGVGIVVPLLPVFAHDLGAGGLYIGLIFGSFSLSRTLFLPWFGKASDRRGRKPFIVTGLFFYSVVSVAFILFKSVEGLIVIRFFQGIASAMIMPVTQAYIGDITPEGSEGFCMGLFNMSMFISLSIGPLLGGMINERLSLDATFVSMGILSVIAFAMSLLLLPPTDSESKVSRTDTPVSWREIFAGRGLQGLFCVRMVYTTCIGIIWCFLPVLCDAELGMSSTAIGFLVMLGVITGGVLQTPMGWLADRSNKRAMVLIGGSVVCFSLVAIGMANTFYQLVAAILTFGIGGGVSMPAVMAMAVIEGSNSSAMGSVMAIMTMGHSLGMLLGSCLAGLAMDFFELRNAFPAGGLVMAGGLVFFLIATRAKAPSPPLPAD